MPSKAFTGKAGRNSAKQCSQEPDQTSGQEKSEHGHSEKKKDCRRKFSNRLYDKVAEPLGKRSPATKLKVARSLSKRLLQDTEEKDAQSSADLKEAMTEDEQRTEIWKDLFVIKNEKLAKRYNVMEALIKDVMERNGCEKRVDLAKKAGLKRAFLDELFRVRQRTNGSKPSFYQEERRHKLTQDEIGDIQEFFRRTGITMELPYQRHSGKIFMCRTIRDAYLKYCSMCSKAGKVPVSLCSFSRNRPQGTKLQRQVPDMTCGCMPCINLGDLGKFLVAKGVHVLSTKSSANMCLTLCEVEPQDGEDPGSMYRFHQDCIRRKCQKCGVQLLKGRLQQEDMHVDWTRNVTFSYWVKEKKEVITSTNTMEIKGVLEHPEKVATLGFVRELYLKTMKDAPLHKFNMEWQADQFESQKTNLREGEVLMVCDFGTNFSVKEWEEPHSKFWNRASVTVFNCVLYYRCPQSGCSHLVQDEIVVTSDDTKHDYASVHAFTGRIMSHLQEQNIRVTRLIRYADNCAGQFKSLRVNFVLSQQQIPTEHNYFCANHGKSAADGVGGRCMQALARAIKTRSADVKDAESIAEYMEEEYGMEGRRRPMEKPRSSRKITVDDKKIVRDFFVSSDVSVYRNGAYFLRQSRQSTYNLYVQRLTEKGSDTKVISMRTFFRLCPLNVSLIRMAAGPEGEEDGQVQDVSSDFPDKSDHHQVKDKSTENLAKSQTTHDKYQHVQEVCSEVQGSEDPPVNHHDKNLREKESAQPTNKSESAGTKHIGMCSHRQRHFFCVNDIDRECFDTSTARTLSGTQTVHCIRNTGKEGFIEVRENTCCCNFCSHGEGDSCPNEFWVKQFQRVAICDKSRTEPRMFKNSLWSEKCVELDKCKWKTLAQKKSQPAPSASTSLHQIRSTQVPDSGLPETLKDTKTGEVSESDPDYDPDPRILKGETLEGLPPRRPRRSRPKRPCPKEDLHNEPVEICQMPQELASEVDMGHGNPETREMPLPEAELPVGDPVEVVCHDNVVGEEGAGEEKAQVCQDAASEPVLSENVVTENHDEEDVILVKAEGPTESDMELVMACEEEESRMTLTDVMKYMEEQGIANSPLPRLTYACDWDFKKLVRFEGNWKEQKAILSNPEFKKSSLKILQDMLMPSTSDVPDKVSQFMLENLCPPSPFDQCDISKDLVALSIQGNDRCLYNAFSRILYGTQIYSERVAMALLRHMFLNENLFLTETFWMPGLALAQKPFQGGLVRQYLAFQDFRAIDSQEAEFPQIFKDILLSMTKKGQEGWGGPLQMAAFANMTGHPVRLVQPGQTLLGPNRSKCWRQHDLINRWFLPWGSTYKWEAAPVFVMHTAVEKTTRLNHFICVMGKEPLQKMRGQDFETKAAAVRKESQSMGQAQRTKGPVDLEGCQEKNAEDDKAEVTSPSNCSEKIDIPNTSNSHGMEAPDVLGTVGNQRSTNQEDFMAAAGAMSERQTEPSDSNCHVESVGNDDIKHSDLDGNDSDPGHRPKRKWDPEIFTDENATNSESENETLQAKKMKWAEERKVKENVWKQCSGWVCLPSKE